MLDLLWIQYACIRWTLGSFGRIQDLAHLLLSQDLMCIFGFKPTFDASPCQIRMCMCVVIYLLAFFFLPPLTFRCAASRHVELVQGLAVVYCVAVLCIAVLWLVVVYCVAVWREKKSGEEGPEEVRVRVFSVTHNGIFK